MRAAVAAIGLAGCGGKQGGAAAPAASDIQVTTTVVQPVAWSDTVRALGTAHARESVTLTAKVSEIVDQVHFESGQHVQAALLSTALAVFNSHLVEQGVTGINRVGTGNRVQTSAPSDVFATSDGHVLLHTVGNGLFRRWATLMAKEGDDPARWTDDPRFQSDQSRADHAEAILERTRQWCTRRTTAEAIAELEANGLPAGPVYTPQQALDDPQVAAMGFLKDIDYPGLPRPAPVADLPLRFSVSPAGIRTAPPTLGEATEALLRELGYDAADIARLRHDRVV